MRLTDLVLGEWPGDDLVAHSGAVAVAVEGLGRPLAANVEALIVSCVSGCPVSTWLLETEADPRWEP